MFTMFQVFTGDGWSDILRTLFVEPEHIDLDVAMFFVSYIFIAGIVLFNVVVAVLLDEFIKFIGVEKERERAERELQLDKMQVKGCLDPLTKTLALFEDEKDLIRKIEFIYDQLDADDSGGLNYDEFCFGLESCDLVCKSLDHHDESEEPQRIHLTHDDFDILTENGKLLSGGEFNRQQFTQMMIGELKRYSERQIKKCTLLSSNAEYQTTVLLSKLIDLSNQHNQDTLFGIKQECVKAEQDRTQVQQSLASLNLEMTQVHQSLTAITSLLQQLEMRGLQGGNTQNNTAGGTGGTGGNETLSHDQLRRVLQVREEMAVKRACSTSADCTFAPHAAAVRYRYICVG
jgi:hypothetical protein